MPGGRKRRRPAARLGRRRSLHAGLQCAADKEADMPIYEYACRKCGNEFETLVRSDSVPDCPACHSTDLGKKLSVFATSTAGEQSAPVAAGPCGSCGHPDGPGACALN
jgi:putative FmdB family regulatory protein